MPVPLTELKRERASDKGMLPLMPPGHYEQMLPDLEFMIEKEKLDEIERLHKEEYNMHQISKCVKRYSLETLIAIVHPAREGRLKRLIAYVE